MTMRERPPLDPAATYTVLSADAARRQLAFEHGVNRSKSAGMSLETLQSELADRMPVELGARLVVIGNRSFARLTTAVDAELARIVGGPIEKAAVMSRSRAEELLREKVDDLPDGEPLEALADAVAGLRGERPTIIEDADFTAYGRVATELLRSVPTGRPDVGPPA